MNRILVANRGEIAVRVMRTARQLGYETVAVFSDADASAPHVELADRAVRLGPAAASQSYLDPQRILSAAAETAADAIHPGYGFLSENAAFARQVVDAGFIWIGPSPESMDIMGNKTRAKQAAASVNVPLIPGYFGDDQSDAAFLQAAEDIGFPVMVKAANGGGGRGMRLVAQRNDLSGAIARARSESLQAFGSDELLLEKAVMNPRHVEFQIFGDKHGHVVHLGERDCSIQRRHQKVIEEAPSPAVSPALRKRMGDAAVAVARAANYENAGTVEFLLGESGEFWFIEMNTRLQVEHPVTEVVTGQDLVAWQLLVADGRPLPLEQSNITLAGHAIEVRLYAETPDNGFLPSVGTIHHWKPPRGDGIRVDDGLRSGTEITPWYDAMIAKIIASGDDRQIARRRMRRALGDTVVLGVDTNRRFLLDTIDHPVFANGAATTAFIDSTWQARTESISEETAALAAVVLYRLTSSPESAPTGWSTRPTTYRFSMNNSLVLIRVQAVRDPASTFEVTHGERTCGIQVISCENNTLRYERNGVRGTAGYALDGRTLLLQDGPETASFTDTLLAPVDAASRRSNGRVLAPMPGSVLRINVEPGDSVERGQALVVLEAMKMEQTIAADVDGTVDVVLIQPGQQMKPQELMIVITPRTV